MSNQRIRIIGKKKFNEETKVVGIRVPISKYDDIKSLVNLIVNNILKEKQIRIQVQRKNGIIRDVFNEIGNPNEEEIQSQEIIDLKSGFSELLGIFNKIRKKIDKQTSGLLNAGGLAKILNELNFDLINTIGKNLNNPNNSTKKGNPNSKNWQKIKFICSKCGKESWTEFDLNTYILKHSDLICDDCYEEKNSNPNNIIEKEIKKLQKEFNALPKIEQYALGSKGVEIINKIHKLEIQLEKTKNNPNNPKIKRIHPLRVKSDITAIKGYLSHVPLDIAPNDDKGVYFTKAQQFVESLIKKYEKLAKKSNPNNPEITEKDLKNFKEEIYGNMLEIFDLLNSDKLETWLSYLTEQQREKLYSHKLLDEYDLLP